jgi:manganese/zinc/iron transport system permease protein
MNDLLDFLSFSDPNVRYVAFGTMLLGAAAAIVGCFAFLRKQALVGDAIAHSILPGVCLAFIISGTKNPIYLLIGATISGWISLLLVNYISNHSKLKSDTSIGLVLSVFFGFGILLLTSIQHSGNASQAGLDKFLFGKAASLTSDDVTIFGSVAIALIIVVFIFYKEFKLISFNADFARSIGLPVKFLEFVLSSLTVLAIAVGIQAVGVVLMAALLITPATAARFWTHQLWKMILIATILGAISALLGTFISYSYPSMPTGPWIVICLSIMALSSIFFAPRNGILPQIRRQRSNRLKIRNENVLKLFYHLAEESQSFHQGFSYSTLLDSRDFYPQELTKGLAHLKSKHNLRMLDGKWHLTKSGLVEAKRIIRLHRLWEMYLNQKLKLAPDHVHNDAEAIEHIITPEVEKLLEKELNYPKKDPHQSNIPYTD